MKRKLTLGLLLVLIISARCQNPKVQISNNTPGTITLNIDVNSKYQIMDGFGASDAWRCQMIGAYWPLAKRNEIADLLFSQDTDHNGNPLGIGLSIWRFNIGAGSTEQGDNSNINSPWTRTECFLDSNGNYDWNKQSGQQWFMSAAKTRGVEKILGFCNSPPVYFTQNNKAFSPGGTNLNIKPGYLGKFASFLATVSAHFDSIGIPIDYLSPINEPQWGWNAGSNGLASQEGSPANNMDIGNLSRLLSAQLFQKKLATKIAIGEAGQCTYLYQNSDTLNGNQIQDFFSSSSANNIATLNNLYPVISSHSYWTVYPVSTLISTRQSVAAQINLVDPTLKYWESEYCILEAANTDEAAGQSRDLTMTTALYVSRIIHYAITEGQASSWSWWTALTIGDYKDGLIYLDDGTNNGVTDVSQPTYCMNDGYIRQSKLLWAVGNFSQFVRPGMVRIAVGSSGIIADQPYGLLTSAYLDPVKKKVVVVIINYSSVPQTASLNFLNASIKSNVISSYVTSSAGNLTCSKVPATSVLFSGNSITTLVMNLN